MGEGALVAKAASGGTAPAVLYMHTATGLALVMIFIHIAPSVLTAVVKHTLAVLAVGMGTGPGLVGHWIEGERHSCGKELV